MRFVSSEFAACVPKGASEVQVSSHKLLFMDSDLESVIVQYRAQELNEDGKIGERDKG
jgi:hypothetical protein